MSDWIIFWNDYLSLSTTFYQIDSRVSISSTLCGRIFHIKVVCLITFWLCQKNSYEKFACLTLMKVTPEVNSWKVEILTFWNKSWKWCFLKDEFDQESSNEVVEFTESDNRCANAQTHPTANCCWKKPSAGVYFINVLHAFFSYKCAFLAPKFHSKAVFWVWNFWHQKFETKIARKRRWWNWHQVSISPIFYE